MSDALFAEQIRGWIPSIAEPIGPGEMVIAWINRVARVTGIPASRLKSYWHRKIGAPRIHEYIAIRDAALSAQRRRAAIKDLEDEIGRRVRQLREDHADISKMAPVLASILPGPPPEEKAARNSVGKFEK